MKKMLLTILLIFSSLTLVSCASNGGINSWVGATEQQLISQKGYPMRKNQVGDAAYVYIYPSGAPTFNAYFTIVNGIITNARVQYEGGL